MGTEDLLNEDYERIHLLEGLYLLEKQQELLQWEMISEKEKSITVYAKGFIPKIVRKFIRDDSNEYELPF